MPGKPAWKCGSSEADAEADGSGEADAEADGSGEAKVLK